MYTALFIISVIMFGVSDVCISKTRKVLVIYKD